MNHWLETPLLYSLLIASPLIHFSVSLLIRGGGGRGLQYFQQICPVEKLDLLLYSFLDLPPCSKMFLKICIIFPTSIPLVLRPI